jgi:uncharacterized membrane protein YfcA
MSATQLILALVVLFVGSAIQGSVGFGLNLFAAPLLVLIDPGLVPAPAIVASGALNLLVIRRERAPHVWRQMRWPIVFQVPGALAGALLVAAVAGENLTIVFSVLILLAVGLSVSGLHPARTPRNLGIAGAVSGLMGTAVGIGGPPIALLFQRASGPEIRASLSRYFGAANVISILMLALVGQLSLDDVATGVRLMPAVLAGYLASSLLLGRIDARLVRIAVLGLSAASAVVALARALL